MIKQEISASDIVTMFVKYFHENSYWYGQITFIDSFP